MTEYGKNRWKQAQEWAKRAGVCLTCEMGATRLGRHKGCTDAPPPETSKGLLQTLPSTWEKP